MLDSTLHDATAYPLRSAHLMLEHILACFRVAELIGAIRKTAKEWLHSVTAKSKLQSTIADLEDQLAIFKETTQKELERAHERERITLTFVHYHLVHEVRDAVVKMQNASNDLKNASQHRSESITQFAKSD